MQRLLLAASVLALAAAASAQGTPPAAPVRAVTLFEAGLAELTRDAGGSVTLAVPLRDVDDVLKSLLVRGEGVTGARVALDGPEPVADAFALLPFPPEAATDPAALLRAVPGVRVRVAEPGYPGGRDGVLMGVGEDCGTETGCDTILTVLHDDGAIRRHVWDEDLEVAILDAAIQADLARGLEALREGAGGTVRDVAVTLEGDAGGAQLSYVVAAPAWKTAYRALTAGDGGVDLQAWAVVENATGEDWEDVALTLSSGSPVTLRADLYGRDWRYREEVTADDGYAPDVPVPMAAMEVDQAADGFAAGVASAARAVPVAPAPVAAQAQAAEGVLDSRFALDAPVTLAAGEVLSLPFLAEPLDARGLALWRGAGVTRTGNPDMVLEVTNDLPVRLPAGIMTVSDADGGYVGDADFPLVAPGATEAVPYGIDRRMRVEETVSETTRQVSVRASRGVITVSQEQVRDVAYAATAPGGEARTLTVDHPVAEGWTTAVTDGPAGTARQDDDGRRWLRVELPVAGAEGARVTLRDRYPYETTVAIGQLGAPDLVAWSGQAADEASREYLARAAELARAVDEATDALGRADAEARGLGAEQERVRRLLGSVPQPSEAYDRFLADLLSLEDRIGEATTATDAAQAALVAAQEAFAAHLGV